MAKSFFGRVGKAFSRPSRRPRRRSFDRRRLRFESLEDKRLLTIVPTGFTETAVATALSSPTSLATANDGRVFVAQQNGTIRIVKNDGLVSVPFASLTVDSYAERGLLGITLDPNFATNNYVYVFYTATSPSRMRVSRLTANGDTVVPGSEQILLELPEVEDGVKYHMGGALNFGADGKLYVGVGDQYKTSYPQSLNSPFGKILRINSDGTIPTDNPFYNSTTGVNRAIWAYGLRNPFTAAFQPGTGQYFINDVGQSSWEEIDEGAPGRNFGWPSTEGRFTQSQYPNFTQPVYTYSHSDGSAITGGAFYNPTFAQFPTQYVGQYFFNDFAAGEIRLLNLATGTATVFAEDLSFPTNLAIATDGSLYYLSRGSGTGGPATGTGQLYKVQYGSSTAPRITTPPADKLVSVGYGATFTVAVTGSSPFTYQWQRNGVDIPGATSATYTLPTAAIADSGDQFRVVVTNSYGVATSTPAVLTVTTQAPPTAEILAPLGGTLDYVGGQAFHFDGRGTDAANGNIPASQFVWQIDFHHDTHSHPFIPPTSDMSSLDFTIPTDGETADHVWFRVYLTVTDSIGLSTTTSVDLHPIVSHIVVKTNIPGLSITLDGQPQNSPYEVHGVVGVERTLSAPMTQTVGGETYLFQSWSDGGAADHTISFPSSDRTYTAKYIPVTESYVSDMTTVGTPVNGHGPFQRDKSNGEKSATDGLPIRLNGVTYSKGLGVHAASTIVYNLNQRAGYKRFVSDIGVDDEVGARGSVVFQVWGDNILLFQSSKMTGDSPTQTVNVSVDGVQQLKLVVTDSGDGKSSDHADWANARLLAAPGAGILVNIVTPPANKLVSVGYGATFSVAATGSGPLSYQWQRDGVDIPGATSATYSLPTTTVADSGAEFRVVVTNSFDSETSAAATLTVTTQLPPTGQIVSPTSGTTYVGGQSFHFVGTGTDGTGAALAASRFTWQVDFHNGSQSQTFIAPTSGSTTLDFTIPTSGVTSDNVWYRVHLTVTDSLGLSSNTSFDLQPVVQHLMVNTNVPGLSVTLDNQTRSNGIHAHGVVGMQHTLSAPVTQVVGGVTYIFQSWSDGGAATHTFMSPSTDVTYTATYTAASVWYLSDMATLGTPTNGHGPVERDKSNGEKRANDGRAIQLNGVTYLKGLGVHAASTIVYDLDRAQYKTFISDIGIDDEVGSKGSAVFQVWGDNVLLFQSSKMTGDSATQTVNVNIEGVQQLKLVVTDGGDGRTSDHADWANARLLAPPGAGQQVDFYAAPVGYPTGPSAHGVAAADLNGDGIIDLASANAASNTVSVLLGRGDGTFTNAANYTVGTYPKAVAAADLNGDGRIDLVAAAQNSAQVTVLMNLGGGVFAPAVNYAATARAHDVALADLDGDGDFDIVSVGWGAKLARVLFNNGDGTFGGGINYSVGRAPHSVTAVDFNNDGKADIAVANHGSNTVGVLINNGNGTFKNSVSYAVGRQPHMVRAGDLNGDGFADIATANEGTNNVSVLLNTGTGTFAPAASYTTGLVPKGIAIGDVNSDGKLDIVTANTAGNYPNGNNPAGNTVSVLLNAIQGKFAKPLTFTTGGTPFNIALADFNGDNKVDIATSNWTTANVTILVKI